MSSRNAMSVKKAWSRLLAGNGSPESWSEALGRLRELKLDESIAEKMVSILHDPSSSAQACFALHASERLRVIDPTIRQKLADACLACSLSMWTSSERNEAKAVCAGLRKYTMLTALEGLPRITPFLKHDTSPLARLCALLCIQNVCMADPPEDDDKLADLQKTVKAVMQHYSVPELLAEPTGRATFKEACAASLLLSGPKTMGAQFDRVFQFDGLPGDLAREATTAVLETFVKEIRAFRSRRSSSPV